MECVGTRGSVGVSGGLVPVLGGKAKPPPGQAQGPLIHLVHAPCPYTPTRGGSLSLKNLPV